MSSSSIIGHSAFFWKRVPADGGFLVHQEYTSDLLTRAHETGVLASRTTRIPLSNPNSNGIKMPGIDEQSRANGSRWGGVQAFWANEADAFTGKKPKFRETALFNQQPENHVNLL